MNCPSSMMTLQRILKVCTVFLMFNLKLNLTFCCSNYKQIQKSNLYSDLSDKVASLDQTIDKLKKLIGWRICSYKMPGCSDSCCGRYWCFVPNTCSGLLCIFRLPLESLTDTTSGNLVRATGLFTSPPKSSEYYLSYLFLLEKKKEVLFK